MEKPDTPAGGPVWVAVVVDDEATSDVLSQSLVLQTTKQSQDAAGVTRTMVSWPGAQRSVVVGWEETLRGGNSPVRYVQLMVQVRNGLIVNAIAQSPAEVFDENRLNEIVGTLVVSP